MDLRFLISQDADNWIAQCVEYDFIAQGRTPSECRKNMLSQLRAEIECSMANTGKMFGGVPKAPDVVEREWDSAENEFRMTAEIASENDSPLAPLLWYSV